MKKIDKKLEIPYLTAFAIVTYAIIAIASDIFANKMLNIFGLSLAGGILLIPFSFTIRDLIHKLVGFESVKKIVWVTALVNLGVAALMIVLDMLPSVIPGQNEAWHALMGASWRVIIASFLAQLISDLSNTYAYEWIKNKLGDKHIWLRTLVSNLPATLFDSLVFSIVAFLGVLPTDVIIWSIISSFIVKYIISILATPMAYLNEKASEK